MSRPYTRRLGAIHPTAAGWYDVYQSPPGQITIVRDLLLTNHSGATISSWCQLVRPSANTLTLFYLPGFQQGTYHLDLRQEMLEYEILHIYGSTGEWSLLVTGYVFTNP